MRFWNMIEKFEIGLASIGAGLMLLAIMMTTTLGVAGRYIFQVDLIPGGYNMIERIMFPLLVFWALPIAHRDGAFPKFELVVDMMRPRMKLAVSVLVFALEVLIYAIVMYFVVYFVWQGIRTGRTMQIGVNVLPVWPIIVMMPLAFGLILLEIIRLLVRDFMALLALLRRGNPAG
jgi:TRAP-type mannitol/chloroaromatic compound transport system permease small subunit